MGDYCTAEDVEKRIPDIVSGGTFETTTTPTEATVNEWIDLIDGEINSYLLTAGYTAPVAVADDPQAFDFVKGAVIARACADVLGTKPGVSFDPDLPQPQVDRKAGFFQQWQRVVDLIEGEKFVATRTVTRSERLVVGSAKDSDGAIKDPVFSRDMWDYPGGPGASGRTSTAT